MMPAELSRIMADSAESEFTMNEPVSLSLAELQQRVDTLEKQLQSVKEQKDLLQAVLKITCVRACF